MPTSFRGIDTDLFTFAVRLAAAARVFTAAQLGRHPHLSGRSQPARRAAEFLRMRRGAFESVPAGFRQPFLWRLTAAEKRRQRLDYRNVGASQHSGHWLAIGDVWLELVFGGHRPERWFTEGRDIGGFDVFAILHG